MADTIDPSDLDAVARTVLGEAGNQGDAGMAAVASVIHNRLTSGQYGNSASAIVHAPGEFSAWGLPRSNPNNPMNYGSKNSDLQHARDIVQGVWSGSIPDRTGGADHYLNPSLVKNMPSWASGQPTATIGAHSFYAPNGSVVPDLLGSWGAAPSATGQQTPDLLGSWSTEPPTTFANRFTGDVPTDTTSVPANIGRGLATGVVQGVGDLISGAALTAGGETGQPVDVNLSPEQASTLIQRNVTGFIPHPTGLTGEVSTDIGRTLPGLAMFPAGVEGGVLPWLARMGLTSTMMGGGATAGRELAPNHPILGPLIGAAAGGLTASGIEAGVSALGRGIGNAWNYFVNPSAGAVKTVQKFAGPNNTAVDAREIVPGSYPTLAEATANPGIATLQRQVRDTNPEPFVALEKSNAEARKAYLASATGNQEDIDNAIAEREQNTAQTLGQIFKPGQTADAGPVKQTIDDILSGPSGGRSSVQAALNRVRNVLVDDNDNPSSDPMYLWKSVRGEIGDLLDKQGDTKAGVQASRELLDVRNSLDQSITNAVPGFDKFLQSYTEDSKPIEAMKYLQGTNLFNPSSGDISLSKVQQAIDRIDKAKISGGISPAKSVSDEQYQALTNLRDDLRRSQNTELGKTRGSATSQNLATRAQVQALPQAAAPLKYLPAALGAGAGYVGEHFFPGLGMAGPVAGGMAGEAFSRLAASRNAALTQELTNRFVNPTPFNPATYRPGIFGRYVPPIALGLVPASQGGLGQ